MTSVRLEWTLDEFYAAGGVVSFTDRVAAALGIHASTIKTVAVYEGSVIIEFFIHASEDEEEPEKVLERIRRDLYNQLNSGTINLGAPVIDAMTDGNIIGLSESKGSSTRFEDNNSGDNLSDFKNEEQQNGGSTSTDGSTQEQQRETVTEIRIKDEAEGNVTKYVALIILMIVAIAIALIVVVIARSWYIKKMSTKMNPHQVPNHSFANTSMAINEP